MGWNPIKDIRKGLKKIEDSVNKDVFDDVLGVEDLSRFVGRTAFGVDPMSSASKGNQQRVESGIGQQKVLADRAVADAQKARDMPTVLANQARAARRKRMREQSLLAGGASASGSGGGSLSSVLAIGKQSLGA